MQDRQKGPARKKEKKGERKQTVLTKVYEAKISKDASEFILCWPSIARPRALP